MYLERLYTEPQIFEPVEFRPGINFIFGKKEKSIDEFWEKSSYRHLLTAIYDRSSYLAEDIRTLGQFLTHHSPHLNGF